MPGRAETWNPPSAAAGADPDTDCCAESCAGPPMRTMYAAPPPLAKYP